MPTRTATGNPTAPTIYDPYGIVTMGAAGSNTPYYQGANLGYATNQGDTYFWSNADRQMNLNEEMQDIDIKHMTWEEGETFREFNATLKQTYDYYKQQYAISMAEIAASRGNASIAAQASMANAQTNAQAALEGAQIAADAARYDADTRLQIAREANQVAREGLQLQGAEYRAEEVGRPSEWPEQIAFGRAWQPQQAAQLHQGILEGIDTAIAGIGPTAPQAIVGEAGPELATATPKGTQITPLLGAGPTANTRWNPTANRGVVKMAKGGTIQPPMGTTDIPPVGNYRPRSSRIPVPTPTAGHPYAYNPFQPAPGIGGYGPTVTYPQGRQSMMGVVQGARNAALPEGERAAATNPHTTAWNYMTQPGYKQTQAGYGGGGGTSIAPIVGPGGEPPVAPGPGTPTDQLIAGMMQPNQAAFGQWTGPTTKSEIGVTQPVRQPSSYNLQEWNTLPYQDKAYLAGLWRSLGMIAGENEEEVMANAEARIRSSAWTGGGPALTSYMGW